MRLAWPENVILTAAIVEIVGIVTLCLFAAPAITPEWFAAVLGTWRFLAWTLIPPWVLLRWIDWLMAGPARRKGYIIARFL